MIDSYWELYVAYIDKCVHNNCINDIDPTHYEMEWNHFLPRCVFGDWPIGQWLTKRQHAIASALQTLSLQKNCMFGRHKQYLPEILLKTAWPYFCSSAQKRLHSEKTVDGKSVRALKLCEQIHSEKTPDGKSVHTLKMCEKIHSKKDKQGRSLHGLKAAERLHAEKTKDGKSKVGVKAGIRLSEFAHSVKNSDGKSVGAVKAGQASAAKRSRKVRCLETGIVYSSIKQAAQETSNHGNICNSAKSGGRYSAGGFHWVYEDQMS